MKTCIFTFFNFQINEEIVNTKLSELKQIANNLGASFEFVRYNLPDKFIEPDKIINFGLRHLFDTLNYDKVVVVPLKIATYNKESILNIINNIHNDPVFMNGCVGIRNERSRSI
jgi:hypothetical protein